MALYINRLFYSVLYHTGFYLHESSFYRNRIGRAIAISVERRRVQIKSSILPNTVE